MSRPRRTAIAVASAVMAALGAVVLNAQTASADVGGTFATSNLASDPHIIECVDPTLGSGFCLYTSQDMGQQYAYPPANYYPMRDTRAYFSTNGYSNWIDKGVVFTESTLDAWAGKRTDCVASGTERVAKAPDVAPNCRAYHLWAPSAIKDGNNYYLFVPDVSHTAGSGTPNIHTSSRIAVAVSTQGPFGPFTYTGTVDNSSGYMSDPDVVIDPSGPGGLTRYLVWADGDHDTCGGLKSARLNSDWRTIQAGSTQTITINGLEVLGSCDPKGSAGPIGRPYLEGASIYKFLLSGSTWTLLFAAKPTSTPTECNATNAVAGTAQTANEVIAWASASNPQGPYTYQGIVMCGSTTEWTNQATIAKVTTSGFQAKKLVIVYHDSAANVKERRLHAGCLYHGSGHIATVYRMPPSGPPSFNECMASTPTGSFLYKGLWGKDPQYPTKPTIMSVDGGTGNVRAMRYAIGGWERFKFELVSGNTYVIRAMSNGKLLCAVNSTTPLKPACTSTASSGVQFVREATGDLQHFRLKSLQLNKWVSIAGDGNLYVSAVDIPTAATFAQLGPTG